MTERPRLRPRHRAQLEALLREHLPDVEVWAYGSRVYGRVRERAAQTGTFMRLRIVGVRGLKAKTRGATVR